MMLLHPVFLGLQCLLLVDISSGQAQFNNKETHQVYSYTYHFQHNGTTNPKELIQHVLEDPDFSPDPPQGKSIVKTFSNPNIRGFVSKGFLPAGPISSGFGSPLRSNPAIEDIKNIVQSNLRPPEPQSFPNLIPLPPPIAENFPNINSNANYNNGNIPPNRINFVNNVPNHFSPVNNPPAIVEEFADNFLKDQDPKFGDLTRIQPGSVRDGNLVTRVQTFEKDIPNGRVVGKIETVSYNPPPVSNSVSRFGGFTNSFRQNEEVVNNNQRSGGQRSQSYFRKEFRTGVPQSNVGNNEYSPNHENRNNVRDNNQWWRSVGVNNNQQNNRGQNIVGNQLNNAGIQLNNNGHVPVSNTVGNRINNNFGRRLNNYNNNQPNGNNQQNHNNNVNNQFNHVRNVPLNEVRNQLNNNYNNINNDIKNIHSGFNNVNSGPNNFNENTANNALNIINEVNNRLNNVHNQFNSVNNPGHRANEVPFMWDDDNADWRANNQNDWSTRRQPNQFHQNRENFDNRRPFSNGHSGPITNNQNTNNPVNELKSTLQSLVGREFQIPSFQNNGGQDGSYNNINGGGIEKVFGGNRVIQGPNSFSSNQHRGYERNFEVNTNSGYQKTNQWSSGNLLRRLDVQSSKDDFSKDFIDVFYDDK